MKNVVLVLIFLLNGFVVFAGAGDKEKPVTRSLSGRVVAENGEVLPGVAVTVVETGEVFFSDFEGNFHLQVAAGRNYTINISTIGFFPVRVNTTTLLPFSEHMLQPLP